MRLRLHVRNIVGTLALGAALAAGIMYAAGIIDAAGPNSATVSDSGPYATQFDMRCSESGGTTTCIIQNVSLGELVDVAIGEYPAITTHGHDAHEHADLATAIGGLEDRQRVRIGELVDLRTAIQSAVRIGGQGREQARLNAAAIDDVVAAAAANAADLLAFEGAADDHEHAHEHVYGHAHDHLPDLPHGLSVSGSGSARHALEGYYVHADNWLITFTVERGSAAGAQDVKAVFTAHVVDPLRTVAFSKTYLLSDAEPTAAGGDRFDPPHRADGELRVDVVLTTANGQPLPPAVDAAVTWTITAVGP